MNDQHAVILTADDVAFVGDLSRRLLYGGWEAEGHRLAAIAAKLPVVRACLGRAEKYPAPGEEVARA